MDCEFCRIVQEQSDGKVLFQDDQVTAFHDIHPAAPVHLLVISNRHIGSMEDLTEQDEILAGHLLMVARDLAHRFDLQHSGYRLVINTGRGGGQTVFHLHVHVLGGFGSAGR